MKILFNGCSITWGDELTDRENQRYSRLVSNHYNAEEVNLASNGISNDRIVRESIAYLDKNSVDLIVVQFTLHTRIEWFRKDGSILDMHIHQKRHPASFYYKWIYNDYNGIENMWKNLVLFDTYCTQKRIKYVPLLADHHENALQLKNNWQKLYHGKPLTHLHRGVLKRTPKPHMMSSGNIPEGYIPENFTLPNNHPSPRGHKVIAEKVIELIDDVFVF